MKLPEFHERSKEEFKQLISPEKILLNYITLVDLMAKEIQVLRKKRSAKVLETSLKILKKTYYDNQPFSKRLAFISWKFISSLGIKYLGKSFTSFVTTTNDYDMKSRSLPTHLTPKPTGEILYLRGKFMTRFKDPCHFCKTPTDRQDQNGDHSICEPCSNDRCYRCELGDIEHETRDGRYICTDCYTDEIDFIMDMELA